MARLDNIITEQELVKAPFSAAATLKGAIQIARYISPRPEAEAAVIVDIREMGKHRRATSEWRPLTLPLRATAGRLLADAALANRP
jgi:hypothetical protein